MAQSRPFTTPRVPQLSDLPTKPQNPYSLPGQPDGGRLLNKRRLDKRRYHRRKMAKISRAINRKVAKVGHR